MSDRALHHTCPTCGNEVELVAPKISQSSAYCDQCGFVYLPPLHDEPDRPEPDDRPARYSVKR